MAECHRQALEGKKSIETDEHTVGLDLFELDLLTIKSVVKTVICCSFIQG